MVDPFEQAKLRSRALKESIHGELLNHIVECSEFIKRLDPGRRYAWLPLVIQDLFEEQGGVCAITGESLDEYFEVDHIIPFSYGGGNEKSNLRLVSRSANRSRGNRDVDYKKLLRYIEDRYMNRPSNDM